MTSRRKQNRYINLRNKFKNVESLLKSIYTNPSDAGSFGGKERLFIRSRQINSKIKRQDVDKFLRSFDTYTLHKDRRKIFPRQRTIVPEMNYQWQADLVIIPHLAKENDGYQNLLTVIDVFSRYAYVEPVRSKNAQQVSEAFERVLRRSKYVPKVLHTDKGTEFTNAIFQRLLKNHNITHLTTASDTKAALCERFNRTLKERMWRYFTLYHTHRYIDILQQLVESYNKSEHRMIGMAPANVTFKNQHKIKANLEKTAGTRAGRRVKPLYKLGDAVRIDRAKQIFEKGYEEKWSKEIFYINKVYTLFKPFMYRLADSQDEIIEGRFYEEQLQPVLVSKETLYDIERIVAKRMRNNRLEYLLKYKGYPHSANTWEPVENIVNFKEKIVEK